MTPAARARESLRRYDSDSPCERNPMKICDATVELGEVDYPFDAGGHDFMIFGQGADDFRHDDPRWPKNCPFCEKPFRPKATWQHNLQRLFTGAPDGRLRTTRDMPPGAMYDAAWWPEPGPDGVCLAVVLPPAGGDDYWLVDSAAKGGGRWTRTGTIPKVTATPSILTPRYHGFLTDGFLVEC